MSVAGVVLAAGFSRRLGRPKQEVLLNGKTLLQRAVQTAFEAGLSPLAVVVREPPTDAEQVAGVAWLINREAAEGMASSVRVGARWAQNLSAQGLVVMTCDQPQLRPAHLEALCAVPDQITGSAYAGRIGVPAYFPASRFEDLLQMHGDQGARRLLLGSASITDESLALDIDTEDDLRRAVELLARER